eukprot:UN23290
MLKIENSRTKRNLKIQNVNSKFFITGMEKKTRIFFITHVYIFDIWNLKEHAFLHTWDRKESTLFGTLEVEKNARFFWIFRNRKESTPFWIFGIEKSTFFGRPGIEKKSAFWDT